MAVTIQQVTPEAQLSCSVVCNNPIQQLGDAPTGWGDLNLNSLKSDPSSALSKSNIALLSTT